jgi:predicted HNH restriction endonuclease
MEKETISITVYGQNSDDDFKWEEWYEDAKKIIEALGYNYNYVGIKTQKLNSGKVMKLSRNGKKVLNEIQSGQEIEHISMFSLPEDFKSASFDYNVMIVRNSQFITVTINKGDFNKIDKQRLLLLLSKYFNNLHGEIYEMDRYESPLIYASKANPTSFFKSLKIIDEIS